MIAVNHETGNVPACSKVPHTNRFSATCSKVNKNERDASSSNFEEETALPLMRSTIRQIEIDNAIVFDNIFEILI
jgi:hypothetical protein